MCPQRRFCLQELPLLEGPVGLELFRRIWLLLMLPSTPPDVAACFLRLAVQDLLKASSRLVPAEADAVAGPAAATAEGVALPEGPAEQSEHAVSVFQVSAGKRRLCWAFGRDSGTNHVVPQLL